jgi:hypothetical protein
VPREQFARARTIRCSLLFFVICLSPSFLIKHRGYISWPIANCPSTEQRFLKVCDWVESDFQLLWASDFAPFYWVDFISPLNYNSLTKKKHLISITFVGVGTTSFLHHFILLSPPISYLVAIPDIDLDAIISTPYIWK